jgi:threonine synthase
MDSAQSIIDINCNPPPERNKRLSRLQCLRCNKAFELDDLHIDSGLGCDSCLAEGYPVNLTCVYDSDNLSVDKTNSGMFRFAKNLPYLNFPSLGEGGTALVSFPRLAVQMGVKRVLVKNEGQNPTGSHKDRMSPLAIARAMAAGYTKVVASSSGNAGASLASYAAQAGLQCCIIGDTDISSAWENAIRLAGAELKLVAGKERWPLMQRMVQEQGWFPVTNFHSPPVGSNPFGIEGYKTIAYEIIEQAQDAPPTCVVIPTCRGDMLYGIWRGFADAEESGLIESAPQLVAVEPAARLELVLQGKDYRQSFPIDPNDMTSIDGATATYQSFHALKESDGLAVSVTSSNARTAQRQLAENGLHVELSSAAALAGLWKARQVGHLNANDRVLLIATSHGYKELSAPPRQTGARLCN